MQKGLRPKKGRTEVAFRTVDPLEPLVLIIHHLTNNISFAKRGSIPQSNGTVGWMIWLGFEADCFSADSPIGRLISLLNFDEPSQFGESFSPSAAADGIVDDFCLV